MTTILREPFNSLSAWSNVSFNFTIVPGGRTGNGAQAQAGSQAVYRVPAASLSDTVMVGMAFKTPDLTFPGAAAYLQTSDGSFGYLQVALDVLDTGAVQIRSASGGAPFLTTAAGLVVVDTWCYIEFEVRLHATAGTARLRINGGAEYSASGLPTWSSGGTTDVADVYLYGGQYTGQIHYFDDVYVKTGPGQTFNGDTVFGPETRASRSSARVGVSEPDRVDWNRVSRQSARVAFGEPPTIDWYRASRASLRVAFQGAETAARVGGAEVRVLRAPDGGHALLSAQQVRVLGQPGGGAALVAAAELQVLRPFSAPLAHFWNGSIYDTGPVRVWDGIAFRDALAVRTWNGTAWVDQP